MPRLHIQNPGFLCRVDARIGQQALGENHLAEGGGRLRQSHGIKVGTGAQIPHDETVESMAGLVGQGAHIADDLVVGHVDPRFPIQQ